MFLKGESGTAEKLFPFLFCKNNLKKVYKIFFIYKIVLIFVL